MIAHATHSRSTTRGRTACPRGSSCCRSRTPRRCGSSGRRCRTHSPCSRSPRTRCRCSTCGRGRGGCVARGSAVIGMWQHQAGIKRSLLVHSGMRKQRANVGRAPVHEQGRGSVHNPRQQSDAGPRPPKAPKAPAGTHWPATQGTPGGQTAPPHWDEPDWRHCPFMHCWPAGQHCWPQTCPDEQHLRGGVRRRVPSHGVLANACQACRVTRRPLPGQAT